MSKTLKVGLFVLVALIMSSAIIFVIGDNQRMFDSKINYRVEFTEVLGLRTSSPVRMGGVDIGLVTSVGYRPDSGRKIEVTIAVSKVQAPRIRVDTVASIANKGLLGDKMIELSSAGEGKQAEPNSLLPSKDPSDLFGKLDGLSDKAEKIIQNVESLTGALAKDEQFTSDVKGAAGSLRVILDGVAHGPGAAHKLLFDPEEAKRVDHLLANLERTTDRLSGLSANLEDVTLRVKTGPGLAHALLYDPETQGALTGTLVEIHRDLKAIREGNGIAHTIIYGDDSSQKVMGNLSAMSDDLRAIVSHVRAGRGTIGGLLVDPTIYEDIKALVGNVERNQVLRALVRYSLKKEEQKDVEIEAAPKPPAPQNPSK